MSSNFLCALLILAFLESGGSNSGVSVSHRQNGEIQNITCVLLGNENMTQTNWEMQQGANRTKLGMHHPLFGVHKEHKAVVDILFKPPPHPSSSLLLKIASNGSVQICCAFITFPSGKLEQCMDISKRDAIGNTSLIKDFAYLEQEAKLGLLGRFGAMVIGTILCLVILSVLFFLCRYNSCRRRKSYEVGMHMIDSSAETRSESSDAAPSTQTSPNGFDPSKLYAKITKDIFYGRLWKSYQGQPRAWTQNTMTDQGHVYHLLGQSPLPQRKVEAGPLRPETTE